MRYEKKFTAAYLRSPAGESIFICLESGVLGGVRNARSDEAAVLISSSPLIIVRGL
jgi:hypothetical protein